MIFSAPTHTNRGPFATGATCLSRACTSYTTTVPHMDIAFNILESSCSEFWFIRGVFFFLLLFLFLFVRPSASVFLSMHFQRGVQGSNIMTLGKGRIYTQGGLTKTYGNRLGGTRQQNGNSNRSLGLCFMRPLLPPPRVEGLRHMSLVWVTKVEFSNA